jgi:hypothetical protein
MKSKMFDDLPKHECLKPGSPRLGFARIDVDATKLLLDRDASKEEFRAQISASIAADAENNPNPTEPEAKRFQAALLANVPFAIYCARCLETICLIHPEQIEEDRR